MTFCIKYIIACIGIKCYNKSRKKYILQFIQNQHAGVHMLKDFVYDREKLPKPILSGREDLIELYYKAWELAFQNVAYVKREGGVPCLSCIPNLPRMWVWDSCLTTFITNYSNGTIYPTEGKGELVVKAEKPFKPALAIEGEEMHRIEIPVGESIFASNELDA